MPEAPSHFGQASALEHVPIPLVVENVADLRVALSQLFRLGVEDLGAYYQDHPRDLEAHLLLPKMVSANAAAVRSFGLSNPMAFARLRAAALSTRSLEYACAWLRAVAGQSVEFSCEVPTKTQADQAVMHRLTSSPMPDMGPDHLITACIDVHAKHVAAKRALAQAQDARAGFDRAPAPLSVWRLQAGEFTLVDANNAALQTWGADALGKNVHQVFSAPHPKEPGESLAGKAVLGNPGLPPEKVAAALAGALDDSATAQAGSEAPPVLASRASPDTVAMLGPVPAPQAAAAHAAAAPQSTDWGLLANVSHELRSPLSAILGLAELCQEEPEHCAHNLSLIISSTQALLFLVNDLLDSSHAETGRQQVHSAEFALHGLLSEISEECSVLAHRKGLALHLEMDDLLPTHVVGDAIKLRQILVNLLSNAIKFTDRGGVTLRAEPAAGGVRFTVADTGRGIAQDQQPAAFSSFTRLANAGEEPGVGLGLTIARRLAKALGGNITMRSSPGLGTAFMLSLHLPQTQPAAAERSAAAGETAPAGQDTSSPESAGDSLRVLLVEDNHLNQVVSVQLLKKLGHLPSAVSSGGQALAVLSGGETDVVVLDVQLPDMDGLEVARRIRAGEAGQHVRNVPIVGLSAYVLEEERAHVLAAGFDDYLAKPIGKQELQSALSRVVGHHPAEGPRQTPQSRRPQTLCAKRELSATFPEHTLQVGKDAIALFTRESPITLRDLHAALRRGDTPVAAKLAHRLAGSAGVMGARGLMQACLQLEETLRQKNGGAVGAHQPHTDRLAEQVEREHSQLLRLLTEQRNHLPV